MLQIISAKDIIGIEDADATHSLCRAIRIGVDGDYDFYTEQGTWREVKNCKAGERLDVRAKGARDASDDSAPAAGEIYFLY